jgi:thermitase
MARTSRLPGILSAAVILLTPLAAGAQGAARRPAARPDRVPDEVLVSFKPGVDSRAAVRAAGLQVDRVLDGLGVHVLKVRPGTVARTVRALAKNPLVEYAEPNGVLHALPNPGDPYDDTTCYGTSSGDCVTQWAWARVGAYAAWDVTTGSASVRVAVVDTGIDVGNLDHIFPDYTGHEDIVSCQTPIVKSFVAGETGNDDNGHGTHVSGTIGACTDNAVGVSGANWAVQLMGVKVLDYSGSGSLTAVASGIKWAADNGAKVINLSLGTPTRSRTLQRAVDYAWRKGAVLACAAGNDGTSTLMYPAAYPNCIAVAATDASDAKADFSNYGASWVDVAAPGVNILSTMQDQWDWCFLCYGYGYLEGYDALSGTSMATPHVAGLAALVWARGQCTTNTCVRSKIESTADAIAGTGTYWKYGRVNYLKAVQ